MRTNPRLFKTKLRKWNMRSVMTRLLTPLAREKGLEGKAADAFVASCIDAHSFIKIMPHHIIMKEYMPDFTMRKYEWKKE